MTSTLVLIGSLVMLLSFLLVATMTLDAIPVAINIPIFTFCVGLLFFNRSYFVIGIVLCSVLATIGANSVDLSIGEIATRDLVYSFSSFRLGFVNLGLYNSALVLCGLFVLRNYISDIAGTIRIFLIPVLLVVFSVFQYLIYYQYSGLTTSNRAIVVFLFLALAIGNLKVHPAELDVYGKSIFILLAFYSVFMVLPQLDVRAGRAMFVFAMIGIPLVWHFFKSRSAFLTVLAVVIACAIAFMFLFSTYWTKVMILVSVLSIFVGLPILQKMPKLYWIVPIFTIGLAISPQFFNYDYDMREIYQRITKDRDTSGIGDLSEFNLMEIKEMVTAKFLAERSMLWKSAMDYSFNPIGVVTVLPDPSGHFTLTVGPLKGFLWLNGPHHGFLWLLRVYGLVIGPLIFFYIHLLVYRNIQIQWPKGTAMHDVLQPFLLTFGICGFVIGDYPMNNSGGLLLFVLIGLAINYNRQRSRFMPPTPSFTRLAKQPEAADIMAGARINPAGPR